MVHFSYFFFVTWFRAHTRVRWVISVTSESCYDRFEMIHLD